jgi:hypothetical protein
MAERTFNEYIARSGASPEGSRFTAYIAVIPLNRGFPQYFAVYENRSFRTLESAETAAELALSKMLDLEADGTPVFAEGETGFDD